MTAGPSRPSFAARPRDPESWVRTPDRQASRGDRFSARLTLDITPDLRGRIKVAAFRQGRTVADMLRAMLEDAFPGEQP